MDAKSFEYPVNTLTTNSRGLPTRTDKNDKINNHQAGN